MNHLLVLQALDGAGQVSQRELAAATGMSASQVNRILRALVAADRLRVCDERRQPFAYELTPAGRAYYRGLCYEKYAAVVDDLRKVRDRIRSRLARLRSQGAERVVFYGAGEILALAYPLAEELGLQVAGVVDDNPAERGRRGAVKVSSPTSASGLEADAVIVASFRHADEIREWLDSELIASTEVVDL